MNIEIIRKLLLTKYSKLIVVLKLGAKGSAVLNQTEYLEVPSVTVLDSNKKILQDYKIVDTTGAGDCFTAAFCVRYCELLSQDQQI